MSEKLNVFCWSCGGTNGQHHPDCENRSEIKVVPPKDTPHRCGKRSPLVLDYSNRESDPNPQIRHCCLCGKPYKTTIKEWINGTCPHCGAKGG